VFNTSLSTKSVITAENLFGHLSPQQWVVLQRLCEGRVHRHIVAGICLLLVASMGAVITHRGDS
jgi:hypothetical protein